MATTTKRGFKAINRPNNTIINNAVIFGSGCELVNDLTGERCRGVGGVFRVDEKKFCPDDFQEYRVKVITGDGDCSHYQDTDWVKTRKHINNSLGSALKEGSDIISIAVFGIDNGDIHDLLAVDFTTDIPLAP